MFGIETGLLGNTCGFEVSETPQIIHLSNSSNHLRTTNYQAQVTTHLVYHRMNPKRETECSVVE